MAYKYKYNILTHSFNVIKEDWATSGANIYNANAGNVGIGTNSPLAKLNVFGTAKVGLSTTPHVRTLDLGGNINFDLVPAPSNAQMSAITCSEVASGGSLPAGTYYFDITFVTAEGETSGNNNPTYLPHITISANSAVTLNNLPISSDPRVTGRNIYMTPANGSGYVTYFKTAINDNTTTSTLITTVVSTTTGYTYRKANTTASILYAGTNKLMQVSDFQTSLGRGALASNTSGNSIVAIGTYAGGYNTEGNNCVFVGYSAGYNNTTGQSNIAIGYTSLQGNQTGQQNTAVGSEAMRMNTNGNRSYGTGIGAGALNEATGHYNTALGYAAGRNNLSGSYSIFIGANTGNKSVANNIGNGNIVVGAESGKALSNGARNILIGYSVELSLPTNSDQLNIGNVIYATGLAIGSTPSATGRVGIGITTPSSLLDVAGTVTANQYKLSALNTAPASATDTGVLGEIRITSDYIYVCVATNTWVRSQLTTW